MKGVCIDCFKYGHIASASGGLLCDKCAPPLPPKTKGATASPLLPAGGSFVEREAQRRARLAAAKDIAMGRGG